ncbi:replication fork protection component [Niveomyces insectorum RCEF 264]|uniref:Chromosome segregation in meiosis protein n=1 Tax=Niveomyces insectorum RCEF 264 TaxID=1081102 RepID=A0A167UTI3_9HYPO|nr:replication fork protection component [Niveomyces insectorum RCEF 264]
MAAAKVRPPRQPDAAASYGDYLPADLSDFDGLFSDEEDAGRGRERSSGKDKRPLNEDTAGLGIDEEVSVNKRVREPRVKLDESRLLSAKGIPALRQRARNLKLKGKGHEVGWDRLVACCIYRVSVQIDELTVGWTQFSDASRLLSMYQLWLDDLFPKARFADALVMVEKEGHKTSMHKMRMEWINESKPKDQPDEEEAEAEQRQADKQQESGQQQQQQQQQRLQGQLSGTVPRETSVPPEEDLIDEDLYGASPLPTTPGREMQSVANHAGGEMPDEDELDALMAEAMEAHEPAHNPPRPPAREEREDEFDDLDALMAEAEAIA